MTPSLTWTKDPGPRLQGSRDLDCSKLQAPSIVALPGGGYRLFYTAVGPARPYPVCQGYILSAVSSDGLTFEKEPGIRLAPQPGVPHMSHRLVSPSVTRCADGRWRMYVESRGSADRPTVICSAVSDDLLHWEHEEGIRLQYREGVGGPRYTALPDGRGRLYGFEAVYGPGGRASGACISQRVISAITEDGLTFAVEPGYRLLDRQTWYDNAGITAAEVIPPTRAGDPLDDVLLYLGGRAAGPRSCRSTPARTPTRRRTAAVKTSPPPPSPRTCPATARASWRRHRPTAWRGSTSGASSTARGMAGTAWMPCTPRTCR